MRRIVHKVDMAGRKAGLKLNAKKTKVMHIKRNNRENHILRLITSLWKMLNILNT